MKCECCNIRFAKMRLYSGIENNSMFYFCNQCNDLMAEPYMILLKEVWAYNWAGIDLPDSLKECHTFNPVTHKYVSGEELYKAEKDGRFRG